MLMSKEQDEANSGQTSGDAGLLRVNGEGDRVRVRRGQLRGLG